MSGKIWFHADDYGVTVEQSSRILECFQEGALNSISVLPNSEMLNECRKLLDETDTSYKIRRVLHINLVEGKTVADKDKVSLLVDEEGMLCRSFVKIWLWNYLLFGKKRKELKRQLKCEIAAQLDAVTSQCNYHITAIDSHQHYHMIPIVFDAMLEVIEESGVAIQEIRIPVDPLIPLFDNKNCLFSAKMINWVKWLILKTSEKRNRRRLQRKAIIAPTFLGIFYTCDMQYDIVEALLPAYLQYACKKNTDLELMFHPGGLINRNELLDYRRDELAEFYMSDKRAIEAECLKKLRYEYKQ